MKRMIAIVTALITLLNGLGLSGILFAADGQYGFMTEFEQRLTEGRTNSIPETAVQHLVGSNAFISWDIQTPTGGQLDSGRFVLQYPLPNGRVAQFTVEKSAASATAFYDVYNAAGGSIAVGGHKIYTDPLSATTGASYFVHTQHGAVAGQPNYLPYNQFSNDGAAFGYYVDQTQTKPTFRINRGEGFSFKFENQTIQFLWDALNGRFYYMTDAFEQSKVFPAKLFLATDVSNPVYGEPAQQNISTGISNDLIESNPISNGKRMGDVLDHTANANPMENPAEDDNLMEIRIRIPEVWDAANNRFAVGAATQDAIGFKLDLMNNLNPIQVIIDNLFNPVTSSVSGSAFYGAAQNGGKPTRVNAAGAADPAGEYVLFTLGPLSYGQLFEATTNFTGKAGYAFNYGKIDYGKFYTFLRYSIAQIGAQYYAIIEPYQGYSGYYRLMVDPFGNDSDTGKSVTSYSDGLHSVYMPLTLAENSEHVYTYQVRFSPGVNFDSGGYTVYSQTTRYQAGEGTLTLGIPGNFTVLNHRFIPYDELSPDPDRDEKGQLYLDLRWEIGREEMVENLAARSSNGEIELRYHIYDTLAPYAVNEDGTPDTTQNDLLTTVIMRVKAMPDGRYAVTYSDTEDKLVFSDEVPATRYFTGDGATPNDSVIETATRDTLYRAYVRFDTLAYNKNAITSPATPASAIDFYYPNIYFLSVQPAALTSSIPDGSGGHTPVTDNLENTVGGSLYDSMTLDDYDRLTPPAPGGLTAYDAKTVTDAETGVTTETSMKVRWIVPGEKIKEYIDGSYPYDYNRIAFNLYAGQSEEPLKPIAQIAGAAERIAPPVVPFAFTDIYDQETGRLYLSDINGAAAPRVDGKTPLDYLRQGSPIAITAIPISLSDATTAAVLAGAPHTADYLLDGLDKNQNYYFSMDMTAGFYTRTDPANAAPVFPGDYTHSKTENSIMTGIVAETSMADEQKPGPADKFPPAPGLAKEDISLSQATILWNKITEPEAVESGVTFEYEIIRVRDFPLEAAMLDSRTAFPTFFNQTIKNTNKAGLRTAGNAVSVFDGTAFVPPPEGHYAYDAVTQTVRLTDNTLSPNQLYFYYVRTVRMVDGKMLYSVWSDISVTTTPVKPPINLKVDRTDTTVRYDDEHAFLITFDAPLTDIARLGPDYALQYAIQKEGGDWSPARTMPVAALTAVGRYGASATEGYTFFKYVVDEVYENGAWTALQSGTAYSVRVRFVDLTTGDQSVYSNTAEARTELDQDEYDDGKVKDEWTDYLRSELMQLVKDPYWYAKETTGETIVLYRPAVFNELLAAAQGSHLELVPTDAGTARYYLPASAVLAAEKAGKGFKLVNENVEALLPPGALDDAYGQAFIDIRAKIKEGGLSDYYVRLTYSKRYTSRQVNGYDPLSDEFELRIETVGNVTDNFSFDDAVFNLLLAEVTRQVESKWNADEIMERIDDDETDAAMVRFIAEIVADAKADLAERVERALDRTTQTVYTVHTLTAPMTLRYNDPTQGLTVKGFQYTGVSGLWTERATTIAGSVYSMTAAAPGTFLFAGNKLYLPNIETVPGAADLTALIIKYGLDDYLGKGAVFSLTANVTGHMAAGVAARLMGAAKTSDPAAFLKGKGYVVSTRTIGQPLSKQEAIWLMMGVYETKTNTKTASLRITNYTLTANVKNLSPTYAPIVRAALQMGLATDKAMDAKANLSVRELLEMLLRLKDRAKL